MASADPSGRSCNEAGQQDDDDRPDRSRHDLGNESVPYAKIDPERFEQIAADKGADNASHEIADEAITADDE